MSHRKRFFAALLVFLGAALVARSTSAEEEACLEAVGGTSAGYVYSAYMFIGVTADAFAGGAYDASRVKQLMTVGIEMLAESKKQLEKVKRAGLTRRDRAAVTEIQTVIGLLDAQARALVTYSKTGLDQDGRRYEKARHTAWRRVARLLGINEETSEPLRESPASAGGITR